MAHGGEDGQYLLCVMQDVIRLLPDLHHDMADVASNVPVSAMQRIELVAEDEPEGGQAPVSREEERAGRARRQRSEQ